MNAIQVAIFVIVWVLLFCGFTRFFRKREALEKYRVSKSAIPAKLRFESRTDVEFGGVFYHCTIAVALDEDWLYLKHGNFPFRRYFRIPISDLTVSNGTVIAVRSQSGVVKAEIELPK